MRYILALILLLQFSCNRIQNTISTVRLDCGSEAALTGTYLRFVDVSGNDLRQQDLDVRSLDADHNRRLAVTSKGCLSAQEKGLWMVRHKEKLEGLVLKLDGNELSGIRQLQDISHETLKTACSVSDLSATLTPSDFLTAAPNHDPRGYEIRFSVREKKSDKAYDWPWLNLANVKPALVATLLQEGQAFIEVELKNLFRLGEVDKKTCPIKLDYSAPFSFSSVQRSVPQQYRTHPFYTLDAEENLTFQSNDSDIKYYEVCWQQRPDWNVGQIAERNLSRCPVVQRINKDQNLNLSERKGFWQLEFRSIDQAGNISDWSEPQIVLLHQTSTADGIKIKASKIASIVEANPVDGAANAMVLSLDLHKSWLNLPTEYERSHLEGIVQLSMHRPWLRDSIRQDLVFQDLPDAMHWQNVWFDGGTKILSYERNRANYDKKFIELKMYDLKKFSGKSILTIDWGYISFTSSFFAISSSEKKFVFGAGDKIWVGELLSDDDVRIIEIDPGAGVLNAKFIEQDRYIVMLLDDAKLIYDVNNLTADPVREARIPGEVSGDSISEDGNYFLNIDWVKNLMTWLPISDDQLPAKEMDLIKSGISEPETMGFYVVGENLYIIPVDRDVAGPCVYLKAWQNSDGLLETERLTEGAPCVGDLVFDRSLDRALLKPETERVGSLLMSNLKKVSRLIPYPVKREVDGGTPESSATTSKSASSDGEYVASVYYDPDWETRMIVWKRQENGEYLQVLKSPMKKTSATATPIIFAEDLGVLIVHGYGYLQMVGYLPNTSQIYSEYVPEPCDTTVTGAYLGRGKLLFACLGGHITVLDISNFEFRNVRHLRPTLTTITAMSYDQKNEILLMAVKDSSQLWIWPKGDLDLAPVKLGGFKSGIIGLSLSENRKHLAVIPVNRQDSSIKIFDYNNLNAQPASLEGHSSKITHVSFFGSSSLLVSGDEQGILKIWDANHPEFPGVTVVLQRGGSIKNLVGIPARNEFIVENSSQRIYHYRLDSIQDLVSRSCNFLKPYIYQNSGLTEEQKSLCRGM